MATAGDIVTTKAGKQGFHPAPYGTQDGPEHRGIGRKQCLG